MPLSVEEVIKKNIETGRGQDVNGKLRAFTPQEFLDISIEMGSTQLYQPYRALFENLAGWIQQALKVRSTLEIGAGPGYLLHCLAQMGINARGTDGSEVSRSFFEAQHPEHRSRYLIDPLFEKSYQPVDAVISVEVFEHIPDEGLHRILKKMKEQIKPKFVVFSSTPHADPNPGWDFQWGHINLKQPNEWIELFADYGFKVNGTRRPPVTEWALLFQNGNSV